MADGAETAPDVMEQEEQVAEAPVATEEDAIAPAEAQTEPPPNDTPTADPAAGAAGDLDAVSSVQGTLHVAVTSGNLDTVRMLLRHGSDPAAVDSAGKTPLDLAEELGHTEIIALLKGELPEPEEQAAPTPAAPGDTASPAPTQEEKAPAAADNSGNATLKPSGFESGAADADTKEEIYTEPPSPAASPAKSKGEVAGMSASLRADVERILGGGLMDDDGSNQGSPHKKKPPLTATVDGVVKGPTFMVAHSKWRTAPKWSMGPAKTHGQGFIVQKPRGMSASRSASSPAPGTYDLPSCEKNKYRTGPRFGFGGSSRFGLAVEAPGKSTPGPGSYQPKDPSLYIGTKVGFGTSVRSAMAPSIQQPGPGAYEQKTTMGEGLMFTAKGKQPASYMRRSQSVPGPGAYTPSTRFTFDEAPKCGFGTSSRDAEMVRMARSQGNPGPGAYEMQYQAGVGRDAVKYSATSRRRVHDLNSYLTPGPGAYNAHVTSFGY